jgi:hypothetical protein
MPEEILIKNKKKHYIIFFSKARTCDAIEITQLVRVLCENKGI